MDCLRIEKAERGTGRCFLPLLLIGDESEEMVGRYLDRGNLYVGYVADIPVAVCLTTDEGPELTEVKNLAVAPEFRNRGIGRTMLGHVESLHRGETVMLGTGETPSTLRFYRSLGYEYSHRIPDFFVKNYPTPIIEEGVRLKDMLILVKRVPAAGAAR